MNILQNLRIFPMHGYKKVQVLFTKYQIVIYIFLVSTIHLM